eukprot:g7364.t1
MEPERPATAEIAAAIDGFFDDFRKPDSEGEDTTGPDLKPSDEDHTELDTSTAPTSPKLIAQQVFCVLESLLRRCQESRVLMREHLELSRRAKAVLKERAQGRTKPARSGVNREGIETRLRAAVKQWPQVLIERDSNQRHYDQYLQQLEQEREERSKRVKEIRSEFKVFCMEIARDIFKGNKSALERVKQTLARREEISKELHKKRLISVGLGSQEAQLKRMIAAKDQLGDGLHLMDFEQLKIENQTLEEKIEERNQEALHLKKKISGTVQVLTHVREKLKFVEEEYEKYRSVVEEKEAVLLKQKKEIQELKAYCEATKQRLRKKEKECLVVVDPILLEDIERLKEKKLCLEREVKDLRERYNKGSSKEDLTESGPSQVGKVAKSNDGPEQVIIDDASDNAQESVSFTTALKREYHSLTTYSPSKFRCLLAARALSVADNFEIIGGVPTFVWKSFCPFIRVAYAISSDGNRITIREGWHTLCVNDMMKNFSLVATWEANKYADIDYFAYHDNTNDKLIVGFSDSTVALMQIVTEPDDAIEDAWTREKQFGRLEIMEESGILDECEDTRSMRFVVDPDRSDSSVYAKDSDCTKGVIPVSYTTQDGLQNTHINSSFINDGAHRDCSSFRKTTSFEIVDENDEKLLYSTISSGTEFKRYAIEDQSTEIIRQGIGFSACGRYSVNWKCKQTENKIEFCEQSNSRFYPRTTSEICLGEDVVFVKGQFLKRDDNVIRELEYYNQKDTPILSILVIGSNVAKLIFWDLIVDRALKEININMEQVKLELKLIKLNYSLSFVVPTVETLPRCLC